MRKDTQILRLASVICVLGGSAQLLAQAPNGVAKMEAAAATPCCGVVAVDARARIVTAREMATGYTFRFKVQDGKLIRSFKVGRRLWADFSTKQIWLSPPKPVAVTWLPTAPAASDSIRKPPQSDGAKRTQKLTSRSTIIRSAT